MTRRIAVLLLALILACTMATAAFAAVPSQTFILPEIGEAYSTNYFLGASYADCLGKILEALNYRVNNVPAPKDVFFVISDTYTMNISKPTQAVTPTTDFPQVGYYSVVESDPAVFEPGNGDKVTTPAVYNILLDGVYQVIGPGNVITIAVDPDKTYTDASVTLSQKARITAASATKTSKPALLDAKVPINGEAAISAFTPKQSEAKGQALIDEGEITITLVAVDADNNNIEGQQTVYKVNFVSAK